MFVIVFLTLFHGTYLDSPSSHLLSSPHLPHSLSQPSPVLYFNFFPLFSSFIFFTSCLTFQSLYLVSLLLTHTIFHESTPLSLRSSSLHLSTLSNRSFFILLFFPLLLSLDFLCFPLFYSLPPSPPLPPSLPQLHSSKIHSNVPSSFHIAHTGGTTLLGRAMDARLVNNPVSPDLHLTNSPVHDAFQLLASRLLRPYWERAISAPPTKKVKSINKIN